MLDGLIHLCIFRDWYTKKQKWFLIIFYIITGLLMLVFSFIIICLKMFIAFLKFLNTGSH